MRAVVQRVRCASVEVDGRVVGKIGAGFLVLFGVRQDDTDDDLSYLVKKISGLRVFEDGDGRMNLSLADVGGAILSVSQFTLYGDARKGNRPAFVAAADGETGKRYYEAFNRALHDAGFPVETGIFGADMQVSLVNDGPVTILLDSKKLF